MVPVGSTVGVGVQVAGSGIKVAVGLGRFRVGTAVKGGNGFRPEYGFARIIAKMLHNTNVNTIITKVKISQVLFGTFDFLPFLAGFDFPPRNISYISNLRG